MGKRIIIIGGGFGGVKCARTLRRGLPAEEAEVVLFNRENHMVFHPLLAEVVGSSLSADDVAAPLRQMLPGVLCRTESVAEIDLEGSRVIYESDDGRLAPLPYDHLIIGCGAAVNLGMVPGMADHAYPMKSVGDAVALRAHIIDQLERAECCDTPERKLQRLSFIVVGGGYSGVEVAGEINDLARGSRRYYPHIGEKDITVTLIHSRDQILPEIGEELREFARTKMERAGITIRLNSRVALATSEGVGLADGSLVRGSTIVCTVGTTVAPVVARLEVPKEGGRLLADPDMRLPGRTNVWAIGDCARIVNGHDGKPSPPTGQFAERQGRQCAENVLRAMRGEPTRPFAFKPLGQLCSIGGHTAVAEMFGQRMSGFFAWFIWRGVYLFKLPSWSRRIKVGMDWGWQLFFRRDLTCLRSDATERVSRAYYRPGDYVFREGDPAANFYVVESGEAEVVRERADATVETLAVLSHGSFFGEMALIQNQSRNASVRARTPLEVVVMGRNVFTQVSTALEPLRELLARAVSRRAKDFLQRLPAAREHLDGEKVSALMEPSPAPPLKETSPLEEALRLIDGLAVDFCYVADDAGRLKGIVTRTDLFRALENGLAPDAPAKDFMTRDPVVACSGDSCLAAAGTMRDHGLKWIPVVEDERGRRLVGCLKAQALIARALRILPQALASADGAKDGAGDAAKKAGQPS